MRRPSIFRRLGGLRTLDAAALLCAAAAALVAAAGVIGADALWLVPLGEQVVHGRLPTSVSFATAPTAGWHDVPAGAQVVYWAAYRALGGERGLLIVQALCCAVGMVALARGLGRQAPAGAVVLVALLVLVGSLPAFAVAGFSVFSVALFTILLALLEAETAVRTGRIWWAVPLIALWGNLHGAVVVGWGLVACYVLLDRARRRPSESVAVLAAATAALFVNPELWHTPRYYWSVFHNEAARQGVGLWTPLDGGAFDVLAVAVFVVLVALAGRRGFPFRLWEAVAVAGLAVATVRVARNELWLLCVAAYPAARSLTLRGPRPGILAVVAAGVAIAIVAALARKPPDPGSRALARRAAGTGQTVLAEAVLGQQVALAGGRVWVSNPLDAFRSSDQRLYVDWFSGKRSGAAAVGRASLVLVRRSSRAGRRSATDPRLVLLTEDDGAALYRVRGVRGVRAGRRG
jgi:hypothetical protein